MNEVQPMRGNGARAGNPQASKTNDKKAFGVTTITDDWAFYGYVFSHSFAYILHNGQ
jgi:hypothetical protein